MYPELVIDKGKLADNIREVTARCRARGISVAGVIKGMNGLPELIRVYAGSDVEMIGSSRIEQIRDVVEIGNGDPSLRKPTLMIRIPMLSEVPEIVRYCDYSLESEDAVLRALNDEVLRMAEAGDVRCDDQESAEAQYASPESMSAGTGSDDIGAGTGSNGSTGIRRHKVILMAEMGDLREGYMGDDLIRAALMVENELPGLELAGVGMNVGCYGSILPTREKLDEFVSRAEAVEAAIGRRLDIISGGATSTLMRVLDGDIPERINHLRIGEGILLAHDLPLFYGCDLSFLHQDIFRLRMEVVEVKLKPTYPDGAIGRDAFGHLPEYVDRGNRMRAICAGGKVDYGSETEIMPLDPRIKIIGASSDHTILDIEELFAAGREAGSAARSDETGAETAAVTGGAGAESTVAAGGAGEEGFDGGSRAPLEVGDVLDFAIDYASMVYVTASRNVNIKYQ